MLVGLCFRYDIRLSFFFTSWCKTEAGKHWYTVFFNISQYQYFILHFFWLTLNRLVTNFPDVDRTPVYHGGDSSFSVLPSSFCLYSDVLFIGTERELTYAFPRSRIYTATLYFPPLWGLKSLTHVKFCANPWSKSFRIAYACHQSTHLQVWNNCKRTTISEILLRTTTFHLRYS